MFLSMKTLSLQLFPDISGLLVNKTDSYDMYNRVVFFEIETVLEFSQCCPSGFLVLCCKKYEIRTQ